MACRIGHLAFAGGSVRAVCAVAGADFRLAKMPQLRIEEVVRVGKDLLVRARPD